MKPWSESNDQSLHQTQGGSVDHAFTVQDRNADYDGVEWFTASYREFTREGRSGYSDFGPLPPKFDKGGGQAYAVVVHLTFVADDDDVWVEHFVSDSVERDDGNATSKLGEAVAKIAARVASEPTKFAPSEGLAEFLEQHRSGEMTSLGKSKRQQIKHHLHTTSAGHRAPSAAGTPGVTP